MKYLTILLVTVLLLFGGVKSCQVRRLTEKETTLKVNYNLLIEQKSKLQFILYEKENKIRTLESEKNLIFAQLESQKTAYSDSIKKYEKELSNLKSIPADTVYKIVFNYWPTSEPLKYRFAENQLREIHKSILERNHFEGLNFNLNKQIVSYTMLLGKSGTIISQLNDSNTILRNINAVSEKQINNLNENIKLTEKQLKRKKASNFVLKSVILVETAILILK